MRRIRWKEKDLDIPDHCVSHTLARRKREGESSNTEPGTSSLKYTFLRGIQMLHLRRILVVLFYMTQRLVRDLENNIRLTLTLWNIAECCRAYSLFV